MISIKHEKLSYESKTVRSEMFYTIIKKLTEKSARGTFIHTENDDQKDNCNANDKHAH